MKKGHVHWLSYYIGAKLNNRVERCGGFVRGRRIQYEGHGPYLQDDKRRHLNRSPYRKYSGPRRREEFSLPCGRNGYPGRRYIPTHDRYLPLLGKEDNDFDNIRGMRNMEHHTIPPSDSHQESRGKL